MLKLTWTVNVELSCIKEKIIYVAKIKLLELVLKMPQKEAFNILVWKYLRALLPNLSQEFWNLFIRVLRKCTMLLVWQQSSCSQKRFICPGYWPQGSLYTFIHICHLTCSNFFFNEVFLQFKYSLFFFLKLFHFHLDFLFAKINWKS